MTRRLRPAAEIVSAIGSLGFDLQHHSDAEIAIAVTFLRKVNPEMFDWLIRVLSPAPLRDQCSCQIDGFDYSCPVHNADKRFP